MIKTTYIVLYCKDTCIIWKIKIFVDLLGNFWNHTKSFRNLKQKGVHFCTPEMKYDNKKTYNYKLLSIIYIFDFFIIFQIYHFYCPSLKVRQ